MPPNKERVSEIVGYYLEHGDKATIETYGINHESLARYKREYSLNGGDIQNINLLRKIQERYSQGELEAIAEGGRVPQTAFEVPEINFSGQRIRFAHITDTHIGSIYYLPERMEKIAEEVAREKCEFVVHTGDVTEGMSKRDGHVYELTHIGYDSQKQFAIEQLSMIKAKIYMIDGNHDRWHLKNAGALIVKDIAASMDNAEFIGHDEGNVSLAGRAVLRLHHGEDGNSYAISYRVQKVIEAYTGGEKPNVLCLGHTHKTIHMPNERNVIAFSGGCVEKQSAWMRGKRIAAHCGFWIIDVWVSKVGGIAKHSAKWYPFY
jgi:predicted phosphodiesterase